MDENKYNPNGIAKVGPPMNQSPGSNPGIVYQPANIATNPGAFKVARQITSNLSFKGKDSGIVEIGTISVDPTNTNPSTGIQISDGNGNILLQITDGNYNGQIILLEANANRSSGIPFVEINDSSSGNDDALAIIGGDQTTGLAITMEGTVDVTADKPGLTVSNNTYGTTYLVGIQNNAATNDAAPLLVGSAWTQSPVVGLFTRIAAFNNITDASGMAMWVGDGTNSPNGNLTGNQGDVCFNCDGGKPYYCTGTTNWTAF